MWSPTAPIRIAETVPDAQILVMLRDPAERAFSQYLQGVSNGAIRWSFREHIERNLRDNSKRISVHYPFLEFWRYACQIGAYLERFWKNVRIGFYEDFRDRPREVFRNICRFLGVDEEFSPDMQRRHMEAEAPGWRAVSWLKRSGLWERAARVTPGRLRPFVRRALRRRPGGVRMEAEERRMLVDYCREDIRTSLLESSRFLAGNFRRCARGAISTGLWAHFRKGSNFSKDGSLFGSGYAGLGNLKCW